MIMEEFAKMKGKVLKIENPIAMFASVLSANTEHRAEKWNTLNTLMSINNHRRIDNLEEDLVSEKARVRFLEDFSDQLGQKVWTLEQSVESCRKEVSRQKKSLATILVLVKIISSHQKGKQQKVFDFMKRATVSVVQNAVIFGIVQVLMRITWLDTIIDSLTELLKVSKVLSRKSVERSRLMIKLSLSVALFILLKDKIKNLLQKLKQAISFLG